MKKQKQQRMQRKMGRRGLALVCAVLVLGTLPGFAGDRAPGSNESSRNDSSSSTTSASRDVSSVDLKGLSPKRHRYYWAMLGGAGLGAGIGAFFPAGSGMGATKGMLIGGSGASFFYLLTHRNVAGSWRPVAWIATYAILGGGIAWTACDCGGGFPVGALIGGGLSAGVQAFTPRHPRTLSQNTGAAPNQPPVNPPPQQPQPTAPPQQQPPPPANPPQANPPPTTPPPDQPPDAPQPKDDRR